MRVKGCKFLSLQERKAEECGAKMEKGVLSTHTNLFNEYIAFWIYSYLNNMYMCTCTYMIN